MELERVALSDSYFIEHKLYPNVDFYSGIVLRALGIPVNMFTVIFAVARTIGWISQWNEVMVDHDHKIRRPRPFVGEVVLKPGQVWTDPTDNTKRAHINGWTERQWRHLDTCQFETLIKARVPQLQYSDGTGEELAVPWAERGSRAPLP